MEHVREPNEESKKIALKIVPPFLLLTSIACSLENDQKNCWVDLLHKSLGQGGRGGGKQSLLIADHSYSFFLSSTHRLRTRALYFFASRARSITVSTCKNRYLSNALERAWKGVLCSVCWQLNFMSTFRSFGANPWAKTNKSKQERNRSRRVVARALLDGALLLLFVLLSMPQKEGPHLFFRLLFLALIARGCVRGVGDTKKQQTIFFGYAYSPQKPIALPLLGIQWI